MIVMVMLSTVTVVMIVHMKAKRSQHCGLPAIASSTKNTPKRRKSNWPMFSVQHRYGVVTCILPNSHIPTAPCGPLRSLSRISCQHSTPMKYGCGSLSTRQNSRCTASQLEKVLRRGIMECVGGADGPISVVMVLTAMGVLLHAIHSRARLVCASTTSMGLL